MVAATWMMMNMIPRAIATAWPTACSPLAESGVLHRIYAASIHVCVLKALQNSAFEVNSASPCVLEKFMEQSCMQAQHGLKSSDGRWPRHRAVHHARASLTRRASPQARPTAPLKPRLAMIGQYSFTSLLEYSSMVSGFFFFLKRAFAGGTLVQPINSARKTEYKGLKDPSPPSPSALVEGVVDVSIFTRKLVLVSHLVTIMVLKNIHSQNMASFIV